MADRKGCAVWFPDVNISCINWALMVELLVVDSGLRIGCGFTSKFPVGWWSLRAVVG